MIAWEDFTDYAICIDYPEFDADRDGGTILRPTAQPHNSLLWEARGLGASKFVS